MTDTFVKVESYTFLFVAFLLIVGIAVFVFVFVDTDEKGKCTRSGDLLKITKPGEESKVTEFCIMILQ